MTVAFRDDRDDPSLSDVDLAELERLAVAMLRAEGLPDSVDVAVALVDEAPMAELNSAHLGKPGPTDVLSFPLEPLSPGVVPTSAPGGPPVDLGDIFICPEVVASNAAAAAVRFRDEMALMVVHGLLHLLGYDHVVDSEAEQMEQRERDLLAVIGRTRP